MRQLYQIATCPNTSMLRNVGVNSAVDEADQLIHNIYTDTRPAPAQGIEAAEHHGTHLCIAETLAQTIAVRTDEIILQLIEVGFADAVLRHGPEARVDAVYDLVLRILLQKVVRALHYIALMRSYGGIGPIQYDGDKSTEIKLFADNDFQTGSPFEGRKGNGLLQAQIRGNT